MGGFLFVRMSFMRDRLGMVESAFSGNMKSNKTRGF